MFVYVCVTARVNIHINIYIYIHTHIYMYNYMIRLRVVCVLSSVALVFARACVLSCLVYVCMCVTVYRLLGCAREYM
jgi:hypothetical protein